MQPQLLLLLFAFELVGGDIFYYHKLKKVLTAIAFARALGRRPTIVPVPIPIPIPISQNEVIRLPASSIKSYIALKGNNKYPSSGSKIYKGSSSFGYPLPGVYDTDSTIGGSNIMVLDGSKFLDGRFGGANFAQSSNVVRLVSGKPQNIFRRPGRLFFTGLGNGRTTRDSEYMDFKAPVVPEFNKNVQYSSMATSNERKKPVPVGERFRLP